MDKKPSHAGSTTRGMNAIWPQFCLSASEQYLVTYHRLLWRLSYLERLHLRSKEWRSGWNGGGKKVVGPSPALTTSAAESTPESPLQVVAVEARQV
jgi:hypothetical protein